MQGCPWEVACDAGVPWEVACDARVPWEVTCDAGVPLLWKPGRSVPRMPPGCHGWSPPRGPARAEQGEGVGYNCSGTHHHPLLLESPQGNVGGQGWPGDSSQSPSDGNRETVCACAHVGIANALL